MSQFTAYRIFDDNGKSQGRFTDLTLDDLDKGEVVIKAHYSGVNYEEGGHVLVTAYAWAWCMTAVMRNARTCLPAGWCR